ncbi:hypothetical protein WMY93_003396 [Mugilogobius chulae]|uniref:ST8 alpha-N-acetyl-neuraminide alpha-2,8-sialyltransferase 6 n=1 Tax=Mugilogobius chulae TaxID=88201 RepID=A0AAW0Q4S7_9GOBI
MHEAFGQSESLWLFQKLSLLSPLEARNCNVLLLSLSSSVTSYRRYGSLLDHRRQFVEDLSIYGDSMIFLPAFSLLSKTQVCLRAAYTLEDFRTSAKPVFMNLKYLKNLDTFWRSQGLDPHLRLSTGLMMVSLALEVCNNVDVYGFWPFYNHPYTFEPLKNHYYDLQKQSKVAHNRVCPPDEAVQSGHTPTSPGTVHFLI